MPTLRHAIAADAAQIREIYGPIVVETATSFELEVPSVEEIRSRIERVQGRAPWLVCEEGGTVLGYAYAASFRARAAYAWSVESSVYVRPEHQRRGIARALYTALFELLRLQGFHRVIAGATLPNDPSVAFHESFGFTHAGQFRDVGNKFDTWHTVGFWELELQPLGDSPRAPRTMDEIVESEAWNEALRAGEALLSPR